MPLIRGLAAMAIMLAMAGVGMLEHLGRHVVRRAPWYALALVVVGIGAVVITRAARSSVPAFLLGN